MGRKNGKSTKRTLKGVYIRPKRRLRRGAASGSGSDVAGAQATHSQSAQAQSGDEGRTLGSVDESRPVVVETGPPSRPTDRSARSVSPVSTPCRALARCVARGMDIGEAADKLDISDDELETFVSRDDWTELVRNEVMSTEELELELDKLVPIALNVKREALTQTALPLDERNKVASEVLKSRGLGVLPRAARRRMRVVDVEYLRASVTEMLGETR